MNLISNCCLIGDFDILLVGAGLFNATLSYHFVKSGKSVLVIDKRNHIAGNCYDEPGYGGDMVHQYDLM